MAKKPHVTEPQAPKPPRSPTILLDADIPIYLTAAGYEEENDWDDSYSITFQTQKAKEALGEKFGQIVSRTKADDIILCLSGFGNWRKAIYPAYKANRKGKRAPIGINKLREWAKERYQVVEKPALEADDAIGILATKPGNENTVIVSGDKDLMQVPGWHWSWEGGFKFVSVEEGNYFHLYQTLVGDTADNYPGAPGIGPKKAEALFGSHPPWGTDAEAWQHVVKGFKGDEAAALVMARIARICRWTDWDGEKQEVKLWTPSTN